MSVTKYVIFSIFMAFVTFSCGGIDATKPYALWQTFNHSKGSFHFHYLSPPWEIDAKSTPEHPVLYVSLMEYTDVGYTARMTLNAWFENVDSLSQLVEMREDFWTSKGYSVDEPKLFINNANDEGIILRAGNDEFYVFEIFHFNFADNGDEEAGAACMSVLTFENVDDPDLWMLLKGFEPRPSDNE